MDLEYADLPVPHFPITGLATEQGKHLSNLYLLPGQTKLSDPNQGGLFVHAQDLLLFVLVVPHYITAMFLYAHLITYDGKF